MMEDTLSLTRSPSQRLAQPPNTSKLLLLLSYTQAVSSLHCSGNTALNT